MFQACRTGLVQHLEHLMFYGADMDVVNASGNTPLHICAVNNMVRNVYCFTQLHGLYTITWALHNYMDFGLNIFYLYTLYIEQHIKTYNNIQYTNGIQKKVFRLIRICIPLNMDFTQLHGRKSSGVFLNSGF